ncbi:MAG: hypothetical protein ACPGVA_00095 [Pikeienuella sp.]
MISAVIRNHIEHILEEDVARDFFDHRVRLLASSQHADISEDALDALAALARRYVFETLSLLEATSAAAATANLSPLVEPVCEMSLKVFDALSPEEALTAGLFGVMCDAFIARTLLARVSRHLRLTRGVPLLSSEPHPEMSVIRSIMGHALAAELEGAAADLQATPRLRNALNNAYALQNPLRAGPNDGGWGTNCADEMVRLCEEAGLRVG